MLAFSMPFLGGDLECGFGDVSVMQRHAGTHTRTQFIHRWPWDIATWSFQRISVTVKEFRSLTDDWQISISTDYILVANSTSWFCLKLSCSFWIPGFSIFKKALDYQSEFLLYIFFTLEWQLKHVDVYNYCIFQDSQPLRAVMSLVLDLVIFYLYSFEPSSWFELDGLTF